MFLISRIEELTMIEVLIGNSKKLSEETAHMGLAVLTE